MFLSLIFLITGFVFLIKGADIMVEGSSGLAKKLNIPEIIIGLTLVSLGTSAPELIVNIFASINGKSDLTLGNVLGSNIANTLLVLGVSGTIASLAVKKNTITYELPFCIITTAILFIMFRSNGLNTSNGIVLLILLAIFLIYIIKFEHQETIEKESEVIANNKTAILAIKTIVGLLSLIIGGKIVVNNAVSIAQLLGMSETLIGLTVVAIGTSLPELFASAVAAYKGKADIAIGNVLGSNILNIVLVLGVSSFITKIPYNSILNLDFLVMGISLAVILIFFIITKSRLFSRKISVSFIIFYLAYLLLITIRG